ncbi:hypothetical protein GW17_00043869 [Ensete ventricosum]|nr:hypothetical protein GW17_00043869 [Ensete ventricosum]
MGLFRDAGKAYKAAPEVDLGAHSDEFYLHANVKGIPSSALLCSTSWERPHESSPLEPQLLAWRGFSSRSSCGFSKLTNQERRLRLRSSWNRLQTKKNALPRISRDHIISAGGEEVSCCREGDGGSQTPHGFLHQLQPRRRSQAGRGVITEVSERLVSIHPSLQTFGFLHSCHLPSGLLTLGSEMTSLSWLTFLSHTVTCGLTSNLVN